MCTSPGFLLLLSLVIMSPLLQASPWCMAMTHASGGHCPRAAGQKDRHHRRPRVVSAAPAAAETCPVCMCSCCSLACGARQEAPRALNKLPRACQPAHRVHCCAQDISFPGDISTRSLGTPCGNPSRPSSAACTRTARCAAADAGTEPPTPAPLASGRLFSGGTSRRGVSPMRQQGHSRVLATDLQQKGGSETQVCMHANTLHPTCLRDPDG